MCSSMGNAGINWDHKTRLNLYRDLEKNSKSVRDMIERSNSIIYYTKYNTVEFFSHEKSIGEIKNKENMNIRQFAKNLGKIYTEV